jgi:RsiW-degrading membrane proteinase PrsW (M82 family)
MLNETNIIFFSLLGGIIPAFFWIWFWIREDRLRPEPKSALLSSFLGGIMAVLLALFFELVVYYLLADATIPATEAKDPSLFWLTLQNIADHYNLMHWQINFWQPIQNFFDNWSFSALYHINAKKFILVVVIAPFIEELLKLLFAYTICLRRKVNDEPIDASIYMLTTALGFAAVETALFLTQPLAQGHVLDTFIAGNFRSIGPMLIHLICSAILGIFIGLAFYQSRFKKFLFLVMGFIISLILHSLFNFFISLNESTQNISFFWVAVLETWILVVVLLALFERVKKVAKIKRYMV